MITPCLNKETPTEFILDKIAGGRSAIRLLNSACGWAETITGKTEFVFFDCILDTGALSKNWLKPLDGEIYVVKAISSLLNFNKVCFEDRKEAKDSVEATLKAINHAFKTVADSLAACKFLSSSGVVILTPYKKGLGITKSAFKVSANLVEISKRLYSLSVLCEKVDRSVEDRRKNRAKWMEHMLTITVQTCSLALNLFGGFSAAFDAEMELEDRLPSEVFNFWGTCASLAAIGKDTVRYINN